MRARCWIPLLLVFGVLPCRGVDDRLRTQDLARLPGGSLVVGYPLYELWVTTPSENLKLQPTQGEAVSGSLYAISPSITRDGKTIAAARLKAANSRRVAVGTYSVQERRWTEYAVGEFKYSVAISPDGTKLAYVEEMKEKEGRFVDRVHVINLRTLEQITGPEIGSAYTAYTFNPGLSWSPKGSWLAYGGHPIEVWDIESNTHWKIADGEKPAWSADGKWIAYLNSDKEPTSTVGMVHPDGSDDRILVRLPRNNAFVEKPVWSPDSRTLLLDRLHDGEKWTMDIQLLDLATLKLTSKFKDVPPVYAWGGK
jgi:Tol biopolymer transport system component